MRRKRNKEIEEEHRRNAAVNAFIGKAPGSSGGSITDARLDPVMAHRRMSDGSIADNQDYSRKILRVRHPTHSFLIVNFLLTRTRSPMHDRPRQSDDDKRTRPVFSLLTSAASSAFWGGEGVGGWIFYLSHTRWWIGQSTRTKPTWRAPSHFFRLFRLGAGMPGHVGDRKPPVRGRRAARPSLCRPLLHFLDQYPGPDAIPCACPRPHIFFGTSHIQYQ
jgi:hypothetical protein